ncbi:MAG: tetratricopeptide repeat protein, partial [Flavobacteriales bacterium]|nr:tetratricopeptide repeat protein [Flavobacteriales bacterium]
MKLKVVNSPDSCSKLMNLCNLAFYEREHSTSSALSYLNEAKPLLKKCDSTSLHCGYFNTIGSIFIFKQRYDSAIHYFQQANECYREVNQFDQILSSRLNLAACLQNTDRELQAFSTYQEIYEQADSLKKWYIKGIAAANIGQHYSQVGLYHNAISYYHESAEIFRSQGRTSYVITINSNLGTVYTSLKMYSVAKTLYEDLIQLTGSNRMIAMNLTIRGNYAEIYRRIGNPDKSLQILDSILIESENLDNPETESLVYQCMGNCYQDKQEFKKAIECFKKAIEISGKFQNWQVHDISSIRLGYILLKIDQIDEFEQLIDTLYLNDSSRYEDYLEVKTLYYEKNNKPHLALKVKSDLLEYILHKDSLELNEQISTLAAEYQTLQKNQQLALQQAHLEAQQAELKTKNWIMYAGAGSTLLLLIIGLLEFKRRREKNKIEKERAVLKGKQEMAEILQNKLSKELHDGVGYSLRLISEKLNKADTNEELKSVLKEVNALKEEVRVLSYQLSPLELDKLSLEEAVKLHVSKINDSTKISTSLNIYPEDCLQDLNSDIKNDLF